MPLVQLAECAEAELNDCSIISRLDSDHHSDSDSDQECKVLKYKALKCETIFNLQ